MNTVSKMITTGLAGVVATVTLSLPGITAEAAGSVNDPGPRLERACQRIPNLELRTTNLIERLQGDDTVLGSLAWLQRQIDRATAAGRTQLAEVLTNRLAVRTTTLELMQQRLERFPELRRFCADHGVVL